MTWPFGSTQNQYPITAYPGMGNPGIPLDAAMGAFGRTPMFASSQGHLVTGPANFNGAGGNMGMMLQMAMPMILQQFMGPNKVPGQIFPQQNAYDQFQANKFLFEGRKAMQIAARQDAVSLENTIGGINRMWTGEELTPQEGARNFKFAQGASSLLPTLIQFLGPDLVDQLTGPKGSRTVFAQQMHKAMQTGIDPLSGRLGLSGGASAEITNEVYEQLFGDNATVDMQGMTMGQAGLAVNELQARGLLGSPMGMRSLREQRAALPELTDELIDRVARDVAKRNTKESTGVPTAGEITTAQGQVRNTHTRLKNGAEDFSRQDLADIDKLPGGAELMQASDATRITMKLKNMAGAVKAMRDIFGDNGKPNAPMREIINGLETLTQSGLATMSASSIERMVRTTANIAKQTGIGLQGMLALTAQNTPLADQLGLDRSYAVRAAQQAALYGSATADTLNLDMPVWGAMNKEQLTLADSQLRMTAAGSQIANHMGAIMRMRDTGMGRTIGGSELAAMASAIESGNMSYTFDGKTRNIGEINRGELMEIAQRAGISNNESQAVLFDRFGNQEFGQKYNADILTRNFQGTEITNKLLGPRIGMRLGGVMRDQGIDQLLIGAGITDSKGFGGLMDRVGTGMVRDFMAMDGADLRNDSRRRELMGQSFQSRLRNEIKISMPDASEAEIEAKLAEVTATMGGQSAITGMSESVYAEINRVSRESGVTGAVAMHDIHSEKAQQATAARARQVDSDAMLQSALAGLGTDAPIQRIVGALQNAGVGTTWQTIMSEALGGIDVEEIKRRVPEGSFNEMMNASDKLRKINGSTPEGQAEIRRYTENMKALIEGGSAAQARIDQLQKERPVIKSDQATGMQQAEALTGLADLENTQRAARDNRLKGHDLRAKGLISKLTEYSNETDEGKKDSKLAAITQELPETAAAILGDDTVALKDGRKLTGTGIREADGLLRLFSQQTPDEFVEVANALQQRTMEREVEAAKQDQQMAKRSRTELLKLAEDREMIYGDISPDNAKMIEKLKETVEDPKLYKRTMNEIIGTDGGAKNQERNSEIIKEALAAGGDRSISLSRAVLGQHGIVNMALAKGVFGDKKAADLTPEDRNSAYDKLIELGKLNEEEMVHLKRNAADAAELDKLQIYDLDSTNITPEQLRLMRESSGQDLSYENSQDKKMTVTLTGGNIKMNKDGTLDADLKGIGYIHGDVTSQQGMV